MVTRPMYKKKEVNTPLTRWNTSLPYRACISPPNMWNLKMKPHFSPPFCHDWQRVQEARKLHPKDIKMIKDDQGDTRNPYKCMNGMKQDAMDDKIIEGCKTCEKQISQQEKKMLCT